MPKKIPETTIDEILKRTDIVDLISSYLSLKQAGKDYVGLCPFHNEKTPSFSVSPQKQLYYCFGCGAKGDAIQFLMEYFSLSFVDALKELSQKAGVPFPVKEIVRDFSGDAAKESQKKSK